MMWHLWKVKCCRFPRVYFVISIRNRGKLVWNDHVRLEMSTVYLCRLHPLRQTNVHILSRASYGKLPPGRSLYCEKLWTTVIDSKWPWTIVNDRERPQMTTNDSERQWRRRPSWYFYIQSNIVRWNRGCVYVCVCVFVCVCVCVCMYVCVCVTALQPKRMDGFWWHFLQMIWQIFARSVFLEFWNFRKMTSWRPFLHFFVGALSRLQYLSDFLQNLRHCLLSKISKVGW